MIGQRLVFCLSYRCSSVESKQVIRENVPREMLYKTGYVRDPMGHFRHPIGPPESSRVDIKG